MIARWLRFSAVGAGGTAVQLIVLVLLVEQRRLGPVAASLVAVEAAILHNFLWHVRWTWRDRLGRLAFDRSACETIVHRLALFHGTNGLISLAGSAALMPLFVTSLGLQYVVANVLTIAACGIGNFVLSERVVFAEVTARP